MKTAVIGILVALALSVSFKAESRENRTTYVGEGRFYNNDKDSFESAIIRQRNNDWSQRQSDRHKYEDRYQEQELQDREYRREDYQRIDR